LSFCDWRHYKTSEEEGLFLQSCLDSQDSLSASAYIILLVHPAYLKLNLLGAFVQNTPILALTASVTVCYEKEMEPGCATLLLL